MLWTSSTPVARLRRVVPTIALGTALVVGATGCLGLGKDSTAQPPVSEAYEDTDTTDAPAVTRVTTTTTLPESTTTSTSSTTTTSTTTTTTTTLPATTTTEVAPLETPLRAIGTRSGKETKRVQKRLLELGFWLRTANGRYDTTTRQAVLAFQKYHGIKRTSAVNAATAELMSTVTERVHAKTTKGNIIEVDKDRQVLMVVKGGETLFALNTSTGNGQYFLESNQKTDGKYEAGRAITPSGKFKIHTQRSKGWWDGDLGRIYRPKYFNGGRAIHGMYRVPAYPASHGCVRVSLQAMDMLWEIDWIKWGLRVWVYGDDVKARNKPIPIPPSTTTPKSTTTVKPTTTTTTTTTVV